MDSIKMLKNSIKMLKMKNDKTDSVYEVKTYSINISFVKSRNSVPWETSKCPLSLEDL